MLESESESGTRSAQVLELAEEFLERHRRGERPTLSEYIDRHPALADQIRDVFPAMAMMEEYRRGRRLAGQPRRLHRRSRARSGVTPPSVNWATSGSSARWAEAGWAWFTRPSRSPSAGTWR